MPDCLIKAESRGPRLKGTRQRLTKRASAERNEPPSSFSIHDFKPGHAWWRTTVRSGHATGIQKQHTSASFIPWHVRMPVQKNIDIVGRLIGRNVLKTEFQSSAHKIDDQWPFEIAVAISANDGYSGPDRAKLIENAFRTNISKVPDFVRILGQVLNELRQAIVRVRQDENAHHLFRLFQACHAPATLPLSRHPRPCPGHIDLCSGGC
jgi:hypothetical protein